MGVRAIAKKNPSGGFLASDNGIDDNFIHSAECFGAGRQGDLVWVRDHVFQRLRTNNKFKQCGWVRQKLSLEVNAVFRPMMIGEELDQDKIR